MRIKAFALLTMLLCAVKFFYGQSAFPYDSSWKKIDLLIGKRGLPQSGLVEVNKVYAAAKKENREDQWIKAAIYRIQLTENGEDESGFRRKAWDSAIAGTPARVKAILLSAEATALNRSASLWHNRSREPIVVTGDSSSDIATWSQERIDALVSQLYRQSLGEAPLLKKTALTGFETILQKGNSRKLRPTLYDFLVFRALEYFTNQPDRDPEETPALNDPAIFARAAIFRHFAFPQSDTADRRSVAVRLFQDVLTFHEPDGDPSASVDADLTRIAFAYSFTQLPEKDSLYLDALQTINRSFPKLPAAAEAGFMQAAWYAQRAEKYDWLKDSTYRYDLVKARDIAQSFAASPDSSEGKTRCRELLHTLVRPLLGMQTERVNLPDEPFRVLVSYGNLGKVYGRIMRIDSAFYEDFQSGRFEEGNWMKLKRLPVVTTFSFDLPATSDLREHKVELPMKPLSIGRYAVLIGTDPEFPPGARAAVSFIFQSRLSFVKLGNELFVLDRNTGKPLNGVSIITSHRVYDNRTRRDRPVTDDRFVSDANGHVSLRFNENNYDRRFLLALGMDSLYSSAGYYYSQSDEELTREKTDREAFEKKWLRASLFSDRGIYRPGQVVFVKSVLMTRRFDTRDWTPVAARRSKLYLIDANDVSVDSMSYVSSGYGSFSGRFTLPSTGLTGSFGIRDSLTGQQNSFSVEEYKRPKFYVRVDTVSGRVRLNDSAKFTGSAMSYSGTSIQDAAVSYRIYREARFPYPWYFRHLPASQEAEIAHGQVKTDEKGQFTLPFKALPDPGVNPLTRPVFHYRVLVTVTDQNGESREGDGAAVISNQTFELVSSLPRESVFPADSLGRFPLTTKDLNGVFRQESLTVTLYALRMPDRLIRERYWEQPDQHLLDSAAYVKLFPNDEYADESQKTSWPVLEKIVRQTGPSSAGGFFPLKVTNARALSGWYLVTFSATDLNGDTVTDKRWIAIGAERWKKPPYPVYQLTTGEEVGGEPGSTVTIQTGTSAKPAYIVRAIDQAEDSPTRFSTFPLRDEIKETAFRLSEADRGGFTVQDVFVLNNRIYRGTHIVSVPWTNKQLTLGFSTWKDKTLPGAKETWKLQILGSRGEKRTAEVLTAMYDASLDAFNANNWSPPQLYPMAGFVKTWEANSFSGGDALVKPVSDPFLRGFEKRYDELLSEASPLGFGRRQRMYSMRPPAPAMAADARDADGAQLMRKMAPGDAGTMPAASLAKLTPPRTMKDGEVFSDSVVTNKPAAFPQVSLRKNFNETAFFLPDLHTDSAGNVSFSFTMPEALTKWRWLVFAHTKDLAFGLDEKSVVTQKDLMLQPNLPRFLRQGDSLLIPVKIANLSAKAVTGKLRIDWRDAADSTQRNTAFANTKPEQVFSIPAGESRTYFFPTLVAITQDQPVYYRLIATADGGAQLSDGEEGILPVLSNRKLVTETLPLRLNHETSKTFDFENLLKSDSSKSLRQHSLTVEYSTRPAWYAVQSLPYMMAFPHECAEQTFDRYYANALGQEIVARVPGMTGVLAAWKSGDSAALQSNLEKNQELKTVLLKETPWVVEGQRESAQRQNLARLLDRERLHDELAKALNKLKAMQSETGGFPWFAGGRDDRFITQYIVSGIGHLVKLRAMPAEDANEFKNIATKAIGFLDAELKGDYDRRSKKSVAEDLGPLQIQYLYMRSFFPATAVNRQPFPALNYFRQQAVKHWVKQNMYLRGMIALYLNRAGDKKTAQEILKSLRENAIHNEKDGMYWKRSGSGYYWQESPVETQALLIETFAELGQAAETDDMKWWLLQQKETTHWNSTKSTADACYALLMNGADWLGSDQGVSIRLGKTSIGSEQEKGVAGTGYFKKVFPADRLEPGMGHITVTPAAAAGQTVPSFGAVYWQYFEDLDKIPSAGNSLNVSRSFFLQKNTDRGMTGEAVAPGTALHAGDKLLLRFIIKTDRDLSYVHLQDQRAACLEPVDALSGYRWQGDLGFYQAPGDESTSFFFDYLPKGTHVVEYSTYVTTNGVFSGGVGTLQTMYAPEFSAHTAGSRLRVTEK